MAYYIVLVGIIATMITRFLPFILYQGKHASHPVVVYLGKVLPSASISLLVVYVFKDVSVVEVTSIVPTVLASVTVVTLHLTWRQSLVSIIGGTMVYMICLQLLF